jgi:hypothetical protein
MQIGNVELPIVSAIEDGTEAEVDEIKPFNPLDPVVSKHEAKVPTLTIIGFVNEEMHSSGLTIPEQKQRLKNLRKNDVLDNTFTYDTYKGHLMIENVDFSDNADSKTVNSVEIEARYLPWPKYYEEHEP